MAVWERFMQAANSGLNAALSTWRNGPPISSWDELRFRYAERLLAYRGELFVDAWRSNPYKNDPRVYKNISMLWNHVSLVVNFYTHMVYQGELRAEPDEGAIPIRPDVNLNEQQVANLFSAIDALYVKWNWQKQMVLRPKLGAALGDVMTELIDDTDRRFVYPKIIWPGYVKEIDLDYVGNVDAYTLEYQITEQHENGREETYTFRKEVDEEAFRYFKDDRPFDYYGEGSTVPNPYGFVPAVWDRHTDDGLGVRGASATDVSRQALFQLNSLFSSSRDFQHKAFFAPIIVTGKVTKRNQSTINLSAPKGSPSEMAQTLDFMEAGPDVNIRQATFDIGQTMQQLEMIRDGILETHPEATFFDKLAGMSQVTGPGMKKIIVPVKGPLAHARAGYDANTVHLLQMATSMCGMRVSNGDWGPVGALSKSRRAFIPYTLESYDNEEMAFSVNTERDIVTPSREEVIALIQQTESLSTLWGLRQVLSEGDADELNRERVAQRAADFAALDRGAFGDDYVEGGAA